ncbi:MAG: hypothetical protein AB1540_17190, partial [Bdellovibrionota bacterium]
MGAFLAKPRFSRLFLLGLVGSVCLAATAPQEPVSAPLSVSDETRRAAPPAAEIKKLSDAHYSEVSHSRLLEILTDPLNRVSEDFKVPAGLTPMVSFWINIYAKYSFYQILL